MAAASKVLSPEEFFKKLNRDDKDAVLDLNKTEKIDFIPTGSFIINSIIGDGTLTGTPGGFPRGHIVEIFGDESSGKSTCLMSACKQAQDMGGLAVLVDFEYTFHKGYAQHLGLDINKLIVMQPKHFQHGARLVKDCLAMRPHIIAIDSVSAMTPREYYEGAVDEGGRIGLQAQLMSTFLQYITKFLKESNACLVFSNQLRSVIKGPYDTGPNEESSGGRALKFYSSVRIRLKKSTVEKIAVTSKLTGKKDKEPINVMIRATVVKNKIDKPYLTAPVYIRFGEGFDNITSLTELAINTNVIKKSGAFYTFDYGKKQEFKVQGKAQLWKKVNEDEKLLDKIKNSLVIKEDEKAKKDYQIIEEVGDEMEDLMDSVSSNFVEKSKKKKEETTTEEES